MTLRITDWRVRQIGADLQADLRKRSFSSARVSPLGIEESTYNQMTIEELIVFVASRLKPSDVRPGVHRRAKRWPV